MEIHDAMYNWGKLTPGWTFATFHRSAWPLRHCSPASKSQGSIS